LTDTALCKSDAGMEIYEVVKAAACGSVDLSSNPTLDRSPKPVPCDALSDAVSFRAVSAAIGTIYQESRTIPDDCPDFTDQCPAKSYDPCFATSAFARSTNAAR
jgi:hypothetical protein